MRTNKLLLPLGSPFHIAGVFLGILLIGVGILLWLALGPGGGIILAIGLVLAFWKMGVQIDPVKKQIRRYDGFLGIRIGKWESLDKYPYLSVLRKKKRHTMMEELTIAELEYDSVEFEVYLLSRNHLRRIMVYTNQVHKKSLEKVRDLSTELDLPFVKYNPGKLTHQLRY